MSNDQIQNLEIRIKKLEEAVFGVRKTSVPKPDSSALPDFSLNPRTYVSRYASERSGPEKFALLVALLVKGSLDEEVTLRDVKNLWNKMTSKNLLGSRFNTFYSNQAKTYGWVDSGSYGKYKLTGEWQKAYEQKN